MDRSSRHVVCPHCGAVNRIPADRPAQQAKCGSCHRPVFEGKPVAANAESFERHRTRNDIPVVVDFWAPWCGPCRALAPVLDEVAREEAGRVMVGKVNVDEQPALAGRFGVRSIPTLIFFKEGQVVDTVTGAIPKAEIAKRIDALRG